MDRAHNLYLAGDGDTPFDRWESVDGSVDLETGDVEEYVITPYRPFFVERTIELTSATPIENQDTGDPKWWDVLVLKNFELPD